MTVRSVDLRAQYFSMQGEIDEAITRVINRALFIGGDEVALFEKEFAEFCGVEEAVGVASGMDAIQLALLACGIGPGDEVITTPLNFVSTIEAISHIKARPVFVDIDPMTLNLAAENIEAAIGENTKAIIPVHLYGYPADIDAILDIAKNHGLKVIEDAAQGHGATYKGQHIGTFGHAGCFSFHPSNNLGAFGEAGIVLTNDAQTADRIRLLRNHGQKNEEHLFVGFDSRMDTIQAAVLRVKLSRLNEWNARRRSIASTYRRLLNVQSVEFPLEAPHVEPSYHQFMIMTPRRGQLRRALTSVGIDVKCDLRMPLHLQPAYRNLGYQLGDFPAAEMIAQNLISLPVHPELTDDEVCKVARYFNQVVPEPFEVHVHQTAGMRAERI